MAAELKLAKAKLEEARAVSGAQRAEAKRACLELPARLDVTKREAEREKQRRELLRKRFVDWKLGQAKAWFQDSKLGEGRRQALREAFTRRRPEEKRIPAAPEPWANSDREGYIELTPGYLTLGKPKRDQLDLASESLARRLYGGRHPIEAKSGMSPLDRCKAMLNACLPTSVSTSQASCKWCTPCASPTTATSTWPCSRSCGAFPTLRLLQFGRALSSTGHCPRLK